jgi:hypothetical protein
MRTQLRAIRFITFCWLLCLCWLYAAPVPKPGKPKPAAPEPDPIIGTWKCVWFAGDLFEWNGVMYFDKDGNYWHQSDKRGFTWIGHWERDREGTLIVREKEVRGPAEPLGKEHTYYLYGYWAMPTGVFASDKRAAQPFRLSKIVP